MKNILITILLITIIGYLLFRFEVISFTKHNKQLFSRPILPTKSQIDPPVLEPHISKNSSKEDNQPENTKTIYSYTDDKGTFHYVDDINIVPEKYYENMQINVSTPMQPNPDTKVIIKNNQIFVPVTIAFKEKTVKTFLLLDTGASITTISQNLASRLGVKKKASIQGKVKVADGRVIDAYLFIADRLSVDIKSSQNVEISVLPKCGGKNFEGLLGLNFLQNFHYQVNFLNHVIEWDN